MKKILKFTLVILFFSLVFLYGCTKQEIARNYGGKEEITLAPGKKLVMVTWKENDLWFLTRPMTSFDIPESYTFEESSSYGVWEGTVIIHEKR